MLVLKRKRGQWTDVIDSASGRTFRFRVCEIEPGHVNIAFDDPDRNFEFLRPERAVTADTVRTANPPVIPIDPKYYSGFDEFDKR